MLKKILFILPLFLLFFFFSTTKSFADSTCHVTSGYYVANQNVTYTIHLTNNNATTADTLIPIHGGGTSLLPPLSASGYNLYTGSPSFDSSYLYGGTLSQGNSTDITVTLNTNDPNNINFSIEMRNGGNGSGNEGDFIEDCSIDNSEFLTVGPNQPPTINHIASARIHPGDTYSANGSFTDPDSSSWTATVDYGDGSGSQPLSLSGTNFSLNHVYQSNGSYTLIVSVTDDQGATATDTTTITVSNIDPSICHVTSGYYVANQNVTYTVHLTNNNPTTADVLIPLHGGGTSLEPPLSANGYTVYTYPDNGEGFNASYLYGNSLPQGTSTDIAVTLNTSDPNNINFSIEMRSDGDGNGNEGNFIEDCSIDNSEFLTVGSVPSTTILTPTADSYLNYYEQNQNEGSSPILRIEQSAKYRTLVKFDEAQIQAAIGSSNNYSVKLQFTITDNGNNWGTNGRTIEADRLFQNWAEGNGYVSGNPTPNRGTGSGVTWNCAVDTNISNNTKDCTGSNVWNMDNSASYPFSTIPTALAIITNHESGVVIFDVTSDIQSFLNGTNQNYGWLIKKTDETVTGKIDFGSKETSNTPKLIITTY